MSTEWKPSVREQRFLFWLRRVMRYGVGGGGLIWAMVTDHLEPVIWLVLGAVATATDVFTVARELWHAAKEEGRKLDESQKDDG